MRIPEPDYALWNGLMTDPLDPLDLLEWLPRSTAVLSRAHTSSVGPPGTLVDLTPSGRAFLVQKGRVA